jgi:hypothetical protein
MDNKKPAFSLHTRVISSVYPQDDRLNTFIKTWEIIDKTAEVPQLPEVLRRVRNIIMQSFCSDAVQLSHSLQHIANLEKIPAHSIVRHFPLVMNLLINVVSCSPSSRLVHTELFFAYIVYFSGVLLSFVSFG